MAKQYLAFTLDRQPFAVPIEDVREIIQIPEISGVPQAPDYMAGVINLRGRVIAVIDLRKRLQTPQGDRTRQTCVIVVECSEAATGMIVDSVTGVMDFEPSQIEPVPPLSQVAGEAGLVVGVGKSEGAVTLLLDLKRAIEAVPAQTAA